MSSQTLKDLLIQLAQFLENQPNVPTSLTEALHKAGESAIRDNAIDIGGDIITATGGSGVINRSEQTQVTINQPDAATLVEAILQLRHQIAGERTAESHQRINEYLTAVRQYCANLPYLTLHSIHPPKTLDEVYVPLQARSQILLDNKDDEIDIEDLLIDERAGRVSISEIIRDCRQSHLLILGGPGSGKSTLLRQLTERAWDAPNLIGLDAPHLPLLVSLRHLADANGSLESRFSEVLTKELALARELPKEFFVDWPATMGTRWLILLDALDEVPSQKRAHMLQWLRGMINTVGQHRVIITSRPSGYVTGELDNRQFGHYDLLPFTSDQIDEFASKWFGDKAGHFLEELERIFAGDLRSTPLLLTIAAKVYSDSGNLPKRRSGLYTQFVDIWLHEADQRKLQDTLNNRLTGPVDLLIARLAHLALRMTEEPSDFSLDKLAEFITEFLQTEEEFTRVHARVYGKSFIEVMAQHSGIFTLHGESYDFVHPTFREYLAAVAIINDCEQELDSIYLRAVSKWQNDDWREVILFTLGVLSDRNIVPTNLLQKILNSGEEGLYFTAEALSEGILISEAFQGKVIEELLKAACQMQLHELSWSSNPINFLVDLQSDKRATEALYTLVCNDSVSKEIRYTSIEALQAINQAEFLRKILF